MDPDRPSIELRLAAALDASAPADWASAQLEMRVLEEPSGRIRLKQQLVSEAGELAKGPPVLLRVVRELIEHLRRRGELFGFARYCLTRGDGDPRLTCEIDPAPCDRAPQVLGYAELVARHLVLAQARQKRFVDVVGGRDWEADLRLGTLRFPPDGPRVAVQYLAMSRSGPDRWMWGHTDPPPHAASLFVDVLHLKSYGEEYGLFPMTHGVLPLDQFDGHATAGMAAVLVGATAYYRCPQGDAADWLLVRDAGIDALPVATYAHLREGVLIAQRAGIPAQAASLEYALGKLRVEFTWDGDLLRAELPGGGHLAARYDEEREALIDLSGRPGGA